MMEQLVVTLQVCLISVDTRQSPSLTASARGTPNPHVNITVVMLRRPT